MVRGQFNGYRAEKGVAGLEGRDVRGDAAVDRLLAVAGVPFFIRAGKCLPVTATEVLVELKPTAPRRHRRAGD